MKSNGVVVIPKGERVAGIEVYGDLIAALRSEGKTLQQIGDPLFGRHINFGAATSVVGTCLQLVASTALRNALEKR